MIIHQEPFFVLGFGDIYSSFNRNDQLLYQDQSATTILKHPHFAYLSDLLPLDYLAKSHQVHGVQGVEIQDSVPHPFTYEADYLLTQRKRVGLAVATADCLPVVFYDQYHHVSGIAHAGWRGLAAGIVEKTIMHMKQLYGTRSEDLKIFLGPAAGSCCYETSHDFSHSFAHYPFIKEAFQVRGDSHFFDLGYAAQLILESEKLYSSQIHAMYNVCTICSPHYASHRRDPESGLRQLTVISLR